MTGPMLSSTRATALVLLSLLLIISSPTSDASPSVGVRPSTTAELVRIPRGGGGGGSVGVVGRARSKSPQSSTTTTTTTTTTASSSESSSALVEGLKSTLASGLAAACSKTLLAPFDTIKTVQQHAVSGGKGLGMIEAGRRIVSRPGGPANLYSGLAVSALGSMPSVGLYFGVYSYCKRTIGPRLITCLGSEQRPRRRRGVAALCTDATIRNLSIACSAAIGNTVASFSRVPYEVVKQSLQTGQYPSTIVAMSTMWREGGMRSFFPLGGVSIQMVRDVPYAIFTLLSYEYIRENWVVTRNNAEDEPDNNRWLRDMAAGATAGGIGSYLTNPFDVVKTRLQTTGGGGGGVGGANYGGSIANCARAVLDEGGPTAFLRGSVPRLMHKIPANGLFFVFYEFFKRVLGVEHS